MLRADGLQDPLCAGRSDLTFGHRRIRHRQNSGRALQHLGVLAVDVSANHAGLVHSRETVLHDGTAEFGHQAGRVLFVPSWGGTRLVSL